jgi:hypothetical protein
VTALSPLAMQPRTVISPSSRLGDESAESIGHTKCGAGRFAGRFAYPAGTCGFNSHQLHHFVRIESLHADAANAKGLDSEFCN